MAGQRPAAGEVASIFAIRRKAHAQAWPYRVAIV
jgi:hypothetical protein